MEHYGQALRLLSGLMIRRRRGSSLSLDIALATLWLVIVYEQRFGEKPIQAVRAHLDGALSILTSVDLRLSCLGARLLVWLLGLDARAATFGQGGALNKAIARCLGIDHLKEAVDDWFRTLSSVYERSAPLFRVTWGPEYPTTEILYDIRHKEIFDLFRDCSQLRLMVAEIYQTTDTSTRPTRISTTQKKLRDLEQKHADLFSVASMMPSSVTEIGEGLTMTLCWVIPHYHASVLDFLHACGPQQTDDPRRFAAARDILKLAIYGYDKQGTPALVRVAWPLFMAGLETPDLFQQDWIVDRFKELGSYGRSYQTAADLLEKIHTTRRSDAAKDIEPSTAELKKTLSSGAFFI
ncbi:hypothetical protein F5X68DRAFT_263472 [Plectosphaerella plurivora]|uniref:Uncharacterized protein n=1 Tax=Plectosphaerella plurivora TaxID=936078 RepID=A0A9P8V7C7_9PEZI|nr:hypothetical protein F5X68DRAFT_263472 [Plectosphaerella plurivora]